MGDFNLDISKSCNANKINKLSNHSNLQQLINDYTRITENTKSKLDLAFVSKADKISSSGVHSLGLSDHSMIYIVRKNKKVKVPPKFIKSRSFKNFNEHEFIETIKQSNWNYILDKLNVEDAYILFKICLTMLVIFIVLLKKNVSKVHFLNGSMVIILNFVKTGITTFQELTNNSHNAHNNDNDWKRARQLRNEANKLNRSLKNNSFTSVETIVVKLQWKMCENQYSPCFEP